MDVGRIQALMEEKLTALRDFERATQQMLVCGSEELVELVEERGRLIDRVDGLQEELVRLCEGDGGAAALEASEGACDPAALPGELRGVYEAGAGARAVLSRLRESDPQAAVRLRVEQEHILEKIRATNQGAAARAARYYSAGTRDAGSRLGRA